MRDGYDARGGVCGALLGEPAVAELTRRHLNGDALPLGIALGIEDRDTQGDAQSTTELLDEVLIALTLLCPQAEVAVQGYEPRPIA